MRVVFAFPLLLLLAAAANAQFFRIVPKQGTTVFKVRGIVTLTTPELSGHSSSALEYVGELAVRRLTHDNYAAQFLTFNVNKYNRTLNTVDTPVFEGVPEVEDYKELFDQPINFVFKHGKVLAYYVPYYSKIWTVNIYRAVLTLFQSAPVDPRVIVDAPKVFSVYEEAVNGFCRVQYEVKVESDMELEINKVQFLDDCQRERPIYAMDDADVQGCPGVCSEHYPENFLPGYQGETPLHYKAKPGCPVSMRPTDVLVNVHSYSHYNVSKSYLQNVTAETVDVLRQYGGKVTAHTKLSLEVLHRNGPEIVKYRHTTNYDFLNFTLPRVYNDLDVPIYTLMVSDVKDLSPEKFKQMFDVAVKELLELTKVDKSGDPKKTPSLLLQLVEALSAMTDKQVLATVPTPLKKSLKECTQDEQLIRGLYLDLLSKAGSKSAVKVLLELVVSGKLTHFESVHALQDVAAFKAYPDKEYVEDLVDVCVQKKAKLSPLVHAAACAAVGKVISKACPSKIDMPPYVPKPPQDLDGPFVRPNVTEPEIEPEIEPSAAELAQHKLPPFDYKTVNNCVVVDLEKHVKTLTLALEASKDFKEAVAYVTALAKAAKPEVLPSLLGYLNGTAHNLKYFVDEAESVEEAVVFFRQLTLLALDEFVKFYPKELNPVVRALYLNTSEPTQLRTLAFDLWLKTVPEKWEIQKVLVTAKLDDSLELGSYVFTALKSVLHSKLPCEQILASRVHSVFRHVKHLDLGFRYSHLYKPSVYNFKRDLGVEAALKKIATNSSRVAASHLSLLYNLGPFYRTPILYSLLPKGGEQLVAELIGEEGLLSLVSKVLGGRPVPEPHRQHKDIAEELKIVDRTSESPKAAFFWKFLNGETVLPVDKKYLHVLKLELVEWVRQLVSGGGNKHFVRVVLPAKQYHVEPTSLGIPLVHSVLHPVVISLRVDKLKVTYENIVNSAAPAKLIVTGTFHPAVLSLRQTRVVAADLEKFHSPSVVVSDVKEIALQSHVILSYYNATRRLFLEVKPKFNRMLLSTHCVEHNLKWHLLLSGSPSEPWLDYSKCYKSLPFPYTHKRDLFGKELGMVIKVNGTSEKPGASLPVFGSPKAMAEGYLQALFQKFANLGWKHHQYTVGLESYTRNPVDRWRLHLRCTSNLDELDVGPKPQPPCPWCEPVEPAVKPVPELMLRSIRMREVTDDTAKLVNFMEEDDDTAAAAFYPEFTGLDEMHDGLQVLLNKTQHPLYKTGYQHNATVVLVGCYELQLKRLLKLVLTETHTLERTARKFAMHLTSDFLPKDLKLYGNVTYPEVDSYFNLEPAYIGTDFVNATLVATLLEPKTSQEETYVFYYNATKSEEQLVGFASYHYKPLLKWFTPQCLADIKAGKTVSYACHKALVHDGHLDQQVLTVTLPEKVSPCVKQLSHAAIDLLKYYLYPRVVFQGVVPPLSPKKELVFYFNKTQANPFVTVLNAEAYLPHEKLIVKNLPVPKYFSPNTALTVEERVLRTLTKDNPLQPCGVGKYAVRTFDNLTFPLEVRQNCKYLVTRDCYGVSNFSVVVEPIDIRTSLKKLYVQLYDTVVEILPPALYSPEVMLFVNKTTYVATAHRDVVLKFSDVHKLLVQVHRSPNPREVPTVILKTTNNMLELNFDGYNVYVWVNKKYQRKTCGVCGNYDNEASHELLTPANTEARNYTHFVTSYAFGAELCKVPVYPVPSVHSELLRESMYIRGMGNSPRHPFLPAFDDSAELPPAEELRSWESREPEVEDLYECSLHRTLKRSVNRNLCFSKVPVYACKPTCVKSNGTKTKVPFVCVPKKSPEAAEWLRLLTANEGVLPESAFEGKDLEVREETVLVPGKCLPLV
ncbi:uncharacterized protein LOC135391095 [Ornithodoros turicata]|uniref:uncharacterized protein LOC135391095 n=1 Tax=Ornithodoros turicata TaxID=34597 RepID=UPI0031391E1C